MRATTNHETSTDSHSSTPAGDGKPFGTAPGHSVIRSSWIRRLGVAGFLFFLIKGLLWLAAPGLLLLWGQLGR